MRVDLAADIANIPVHWFRDNAWFRFKQFASRIEKSAEKELEFIAIASAAVQSLYAGRRPNCIRIFDKVAEWHRQWGKVKRKLDRFNSGMQKFELTQEQRYYGECIPLTFEEFCHYEGYEYVKGSLLTRVERQIGGDR